MRCVECPKCGVDISDTFVAEESDIGIMSGGWYCEACDQLVEDDPADEEDFRSDYIIDHRKHER